MTLDKVGNSAWELELTEDVKILFSYQTPVAAKVGDRYFRTEYSPSRTTSKHINAWLGGNKAKEVDQLFFSDGIGFAMQPADLYGNADREEYQDTLARRILAQVDSYLPE